MEAIKVIETVFQGYKFRSRLEARWAVFFDELGLPYQYELEGFELPGKVWYLPDFYLSIQGKWVEIKPIVHGKTIAELAPKWLTFAKQMPDQAVLLVGEPGLSEPYQENPRYRGYVYNDNEHLWCECSKCGNIGFEFEGRANRMKHKDNCPSRESEKTYDTPRLRKAFDAALQARFNEN